MRCLAILALAIRPANRDITPADDGTLPQAWLLAERPIGANEPTDSWISSLHPDTSVKEFVRLAKIRWPIEHDDRELKTGLGLDHFEGRSWIGWHHHATLVTAAHLFITTLRLTDPKAGGQGWPSTGGIVRELQRALAHWIGTCPLCHHTFPT